MKTDHKKIAELMLLIANKNNNEIDFMKLLKLIYLSDRLHLRKYGRTISTDVYYALAKGPVASNVYDKCKQITGTRISLDENVILSVFEQGTKNFTIRAKKDAEIKMFSKSEMDVINEVFTNYGDKDGIQLSEISHEFHEWKQFSEPLKNQNTSFTIKFDDFFESEDRGTIFEASKEKLQAIREIYKEDHELQTY